LTSIGQTDLARSMRPPETQQQVTARAKSEETTQADKFSLDRYLDLSNPPAENKPQTQPAAGKALENPLDVIEQRISTTAFSERIPVENGMHYFFLAAELLRADFFNDWKEEWNNMKDARWVDDPDFPEVLAAVQDSLDAIRKGLEIGNAMLPEDILPAYGTGDMLPGHSDWRTLARIMAMEGKVFESEGEYELALDNYLTILEFGNESSRGAPLIGGLVGYAIKGIALRSIRDAVESGDFSSSDYEFLIVSMQDRENETFPFTATMSAEYALFEWMSKNDPENAQMVSVLGQNQIKEKYQAFIDLMELPYYELQEIDINKVIGKNPLTDILFPPFLNGRQSEAVRVAEFRGTTLMVGIELYGRETGYYPEALDELVPNYLPVLPLDPFTGNSFIYYPTETRYNLYSVGADIIDNGGIKHSWTRVEGTDIVFRSDP